MDSVVELHHTLSGFGSTYEPAVQRIVEDGLVGAPAVGVVVHMLFYAEGSTFLFHLDGHDDIEVHLLGCSLFVVLAVLVILRVIGILYVGSTVFPVAFANACLHEVGPHVLAYKVFSLEVHHGTGITSLIYHKQAGYACIASHFGIIGTECGSDVYYACTILGGHIVAWYDAECIFRTVHHLIVLQVARFYPGHQLPVMQSHQVCSHALPDDFRSCLRSIFILYCREIGSHTCCCQDVNGFFAAVGVLALQGHIFYFRSYAQSSIGGQCPWGGGPCQCIHLFSFGVEGNLVRYLKLSSHCGVLHVPIASRLVQFVAGQTSTCSRAVGLNGISLVEQTFLIQLLQQPPQCLYVFVVIGDIGMFHIHPVSHLLAQVGPFARVFHHIQAAALVVLLYTDGFAYIFLGDAQLFLHTEFYGQSMGVPSCLTHNLLSVHSLITAEGVLQTSGQYVMDTWVTVS